MTPWSPRQIAMDGNTADEIHLAVGRALTQWERLEYRLAEIYAALVSQGSRSIPAVRAYGTVVSSAARAAMVTEAAKSFQYGVGHEGLRDRLISFVNTFINFSARRNEIAHGVAATVKLDGESKGVMLLPAFYNSKKFKGEDIPRPVYRYSADDIDYYRLQFEALVTDAEGLRADIEAPVFP